MRVAGTGPAVSLSGPLPTLGHFQPSRNDSAVVSAASHLGRLCSPPPQASGLPPAAIRHARPACADDEAATMTPLDERETGPCGYRVPTVIVDVRADCWPLA